MPAADFIKCACQHCAGHFEIPREYLGHRHDCPHCRKETAIAELPPPPPVARRNPPDFQGEASFFNQGAIAVTKTRFVVGDQTFAIAGVTSVSIAEIPPGFPLGAILCFSIGGLFLFAGFSSTVGREFSLASVTFLLGAIPIAIGVTGVRSRRSVFRVVLTTAGGEVNAYSSFDRGFVENVLRALNAAIVARG